MSIPDETKFLPTVDANCLTGPFIDQEVVPQTFLTLSLLAKDFIGNVEESTSQVLLKLHSFAMSIHDLRLMFFSLLFITNCFTITAVVSLRFWANNAVLVLYQWILLGKVFFSMNFDWNPMTWSNVVHLSFWTPCALANNIISPERTLMILSFEKKMKIYPIIVIKIWWLPLRFFLLFFYYHTSKVTAQLMTLIKGWHLIERSKDRI